LECGAKIVSRSVEWGKGYAVKGVVCAVVRLKFSGGRERKTWALVGDLRTISRTASTFDRPPKKCGGFAGHRLAVVAEVNGGASQLEYSPILNVFVMRFELRCFVVAQHKVVLKGALVRIDKAEVRPTGLKNRRSNSHKSQSSKTLFLRLSCCSLQNAKCVYR
jgi:hypothetical protein